MKQVPAIHPPTKQVAYLRRLTTAIGLVQHARGSRADLRFGYALDDNARALVACVHLTNQFGYQLGSLISSYLNFIKRSALADGWFAQLADRSGHFLDRRASEDAFGETIWGLSVLADDRHDPELAAAARELLSASSSHIGNLFALRAVSYALLGAAAAADKTQVDRLGRRLLSRVESADEDWPWFEDRLSYANGLMPWALAEAGLLLRSKKFLRYAGSSFEFLDRVSRIGGIPSPIGNKGWYRRGGRRARFDQQPIDAAAMVLAACSCYRATQQRRYLTTALEWFSWFEGNNVHGVNLIDEDSGGIYDGITSRGVNTNQGAENIVLYLIAAATVAKLASRNV